MSRGLEEVFTVLTRFVNSCSEIREKLLERETKVLGQEVWGTFARLVCHLSYQQQRKESCCSYPLRKLEQQVM